MCSNTRIKAFSWVIENNHLTNTTLNDRTVVVDGHNFFYSLYKSSGLQYVFGCESDKFAGYLKKHLSMFKKANVHCYFIFKGGHSDMEWNLTKSYQLQGRDFSIGTEYNDIVIPIFMKDVCHQVLDEMDFNYTVCEFEANTACQTVARVLECPIVSLNIDNSFSGIPYIPATTIRFDEEKNLLTCGLFTLDSFFKEWNLSIEKLAVFVALTDLHSFPENYFLPLLQALKIHLEYYKRNLGLLCWLRKTTRNEAVYKIFKHCQPEDRPAFLAAEKKALLKFAKPEIPCQHLMNSLVLHALGNKVTFQKNDPNWFKKGVALKHIPIPFINISRAGVVVGSWAIADNDAEDAMLFAKDIIKYAYNLLTNFQNQEFTFYSNGEKVMLPVTDSVQKPDYEALNSPFENGWENIPKGLFEHFLLVSIDGFNSDDLKMLPEDCRMLMIALMYFSKRKTLDVSNEVISLLLSYLALSILSESESNNNANGTEFVKQFDPNSIEEEDKEAALEILKQYFVEVDVEAAKDIFNPKWLHPLVEFQHCLEFLNHLNTLCGCPYRPTVFRDTFNGTFVYKALWAMRSEGDGEGFVKRLLQPAPSVLNFFLALYDFLKGNICNPCKPTIFERLNLNCPLF